MYGSTISGDGDRHGTNDGRPKLDQVTQDARSTAARRRVPTSKRQLGRGVSTRRRRISTFEDDSPQPVLKTLFNTTASVGDSLTLSEGGSGRSQKSFVYTMLNPRSSHWQAKVYKAIMSTIIVADLFFFIASTEPALQSKSHIFEMEEAIVSWIFLVEYLARLITIMESRHYRPLGAISGRLRYMGSWNALIDAFSTFPYFIERFSHGRIELPTLTYLRTFRLFRILKTEAFSNAMDAVWRVLYYNREILTVAMLICVMLVLVTAVLMYYLRPPNDPNGTFDSIFSTIYISTLMLTGQGGPDEDLPWYTQMIVLLTGFFSLAMFAIPASMITWGFEAEAERVAAVSRRRRLAQRRGTKPPDDSSSSSEWDSSGEDTSDEEYQKLIAGEEEEEDEDDKVERLLKIFEKADVDKSGTLNKAEFMEQVMNNPDMLGSPEGVGESRLHSRFHRSSGSSGTTKARLEKLEMRMEEMHSKLDRLFEHLGIQEESKGEWS